MSVVTVLVGTLVCMAPSSKSAEDLVADFCAEVCGDVSPCRCAESDAALLYAMASSPDGQSGWERYCQTQTWCPGEMASGCDDEHTCWMSCEMQVGVTRTVARFEEGRLVSVGSEGLVPLEVRFDRAGRRATQTEAVVVWEMDSPRETRITTFNAHLEPIVEELDGDGDGTVDERTQLTRNPEGGIVRAEEDRDADGTVDRAFDYDPPCTVPYALCVYPVERSAAATHLVEELCGGVCGDVSPCFCSDTSGALECAMATSAEGQSVWEDLCHAHCDSRYLDDCSCTGDSCVMRCSVTGPSIQTTGSFEGGRLVSLEHLVDGQPSTDTIQCDPARRWTQHVSASPGQPGRTVTTVTYNEHWFPVIEEEDSDGDGTVDFRVTRTMDDTGRLLTVEIDNDADGTPDDVALFDPPCEPPYQECVSDRARTSRLPTYDPEGGQ